MKYIFSLCALLLAAYDLKAVMKNRCRAEKFIYIELIYNLIIKYLIGNLGLPSVLNYVTDAILIWIVIEFFNQKKIKGRSVPRTLVFSFSLLWILSILSYFFNMYSPALYIWGFRNNFRFIIFAMMCAAYLKREDVSTILDILYGFFILNLFVVTYQAFFVSYSGYAVGDYISGLFSNGLERGGNASLDWLMCILCTYTIVQYLNKTGSFKRMMICMLGSLYMAAVAEIKTFFVQIIIIAFISLMICKKSLKVLVLVVLGIFALIGSVRILYMVFPYFADFFDPETMLSYLTREGGYSSRGYSTGVDRLTAISYVMKHFSLDFISRIFGRGLGNADFSSFSFLTSAFYRENSWTGYSFFYSAIVTTELGLLGLVIYIGNILNYAKNAFIKKTANLQEKSVTQSTMIICLLCVFSIFLGQTMKLEASAYMVYCVMVFPMFLKAGDESQVGSSRIGSVPIRLKKRDKKDMYENRINYLQ